MEHSLINNAVINSFIELELAKNLAFKSTFGAELDYFKYNRYLPGELPERKGGNYGGQAMIYNNNTQNLLNENTINYNQNIGDHSIKLLGGLSLQKISNELNYVIAQGFPNDVTSFNNIAFGSDPDQTIIHSDYGQRTFASLLGRLNYSFKGKYLITMVGRYDGSSVFPPGNKYAFFPSIGLAWNIDRESFMENLDAISSFKIRGSYGIVGEQGISPYTSLPKFKPDYTYFNETL